MRIALAQLNPTVGAMAPNAEKIVRAISQARSRGADLIVTPELALCGYPPRDLLQREGFVAQCADVAKRIGERETSGITLVLGTPLPVDRCPGVANSLLAYRDGVLLDYYDKRLLPVYDVFDESRDMAPGDRAVMIDAGGRGVGLSVCEDLWHARDHDMPGRYDEDPDPIEALREAHSPGGRAMSLLLSPSASPFQVGKRARQRELLRQRAKEQGAWVAMVNQVGANDEVIFDGAAALVAPDGRLVAAGPAFEEALVVADIDDAAPVVEDTIGRDESELFGALRLGVRDYFAKTGFDKALLGLSGGIDSAVTAVLAAAAVGPGNVLGVAMPSRYSSAHSLTDAEALAERLGCEYRVIGIEPAQAAFESMLAESFAGTTPGVAEENTQARVRGVTLMALSNKLGRLLLSTSNKSELAVGYTTLYGDMCGALAPISDVLKTQVYRLAWWMNREWRSLGIDGLNGPPIPESTITKPPSAELRPDQVDQDTLPPYDQLDAMLERIVELGQSPATIARETGFDPAIVGKTARMVDLAEHKRWQSSIVLKVSEKAFGSGRRVPIVHRYASGSGA